ncbi:NAD(P)H-dependent oxidoreductase [Priestia filamentosa]
MYGSLRKDSYNRIIAQSLTDMDDFIQFRWIEINELPLFNEDLEKSGIPETVTSFKSSISKSSSFTSEKSDSSLKVLTDERTIRYLQSYL